MAVYVIVYLIIGLITGFIGTETEEKKNWSFGIMILGAIASVIMAGAFVIAAVVEMAIGFGIATVIVNNMYTIIKFIKGLLLLAVIIFICAVVGHQLLNLW